MQVYPAVDIKEGRVLRLVERTPPASWPALPDPVAQAEAFAAAGAEWLHVVDMDRALGTGRNNADWVRRICAVPGIRVQVGGNVDTAVWVREALDAGAARVVLGTGPAVSGALEDLLEILGPSRAAVNIDVRDGRVVVRGRAPADLGAAELAQRARDHGVSVVVYRDLARDGRALGADLEGAARLAAEGVGVIAAGGVAGLDELTRSARLGLEGIIVGRALFEGRFTLAEALACSR